MSDIFDQAMSEIRGDDWLSTVARSSLRSARSKFGPAISRSPLLKIVLRSDTPVGAYEAARVTIAIQNATAKFGHAIRDPSKEWVQARAKDRELAILIPKAHSGNTLLFGFPEVNEADFPPLLLPGDYEPSLSERAARELCNVLPQSDADDTSLDAVLGQRKTVRSAIGDIVNAVTETATSVALELTPASGYVEAVHSLLTAEQAAVLRDGLQARRQSRTVLRLMGRLDGVRTRRRIFYLEQESRPDISGAIGPEPELMVSIRDLLGEPVVATVERRQTESYAGRKGMPIYRLLSLESAVTLFK